MELDGQHSVTDYLDKPIIPRSHPIENCQFEFKCPMMWENLTHLQERIDRKTMTKTITKYCDQCKRKVFYCATQEELVSHAKQGHCVAIGSISVPPALGK